MPRAGKKKRGATAPADQSAHPYGNAYHNVRHNSTSPVLTPDDSALRPKKKPKRRSGGAYSVSQDQSINNNVDPGSNDYKMVDLKSSKQESSSPIVDHNSAHMDSEDAQARINKGRQGVQANGVGPNPELSIDYDKAGDTDAKQVKKFKRQIKELMALLEDSQAKIIAAKKAESDMANRVEDLETKIVQVTVEKDTLLSEERERLDDAGKLVAQLQDVSDGVREALTCGVCFEVLRDPHVLTCGHSACKECLLRWFRTPTAYRGQDIVEVSPTADMTYRTKLCHMCRTPVYNRPVRMFAVHAVIEKVSSAKEHSTQMIRKSPDHTTADANPWKNIFPPDAHGYVIRYEDEHVRRCPLCGSEIVDWTCDTCAAEFSDEDLAFSGSDDESDHSDNSDNSRLEGILDDQAGLDDDHLIAAARRAAGDPDWNTTVPRRRREHDLLRLVDDIADESDGDSDSNGYASSEGNPIDFRGLHHGASRTRYISPGAILRGEVPIRRPSSPVDDEDVDMSYESSFIDDDEEVEHVDDDSELAASVGESDHSVDDHNDDRGNQPDEPSIDELRRRRARRYDHASDQGEEEPAEADDSEPSPTSRARTWLQRLRGARNRRRQGRVVMSSDSDSD